MPVSIGCAMLEDLIQTALTLTSDKIAYLLVLLTTLLAVCGNAAAGPGTAVVVAEKLLLNGLSHVCWSRSDHEIEIQASPLQ
jgi:hypothetical protein